MLCKDTLHTENFKYNVCSWKWKDEKSYTLNTNSLFFFNKKQECLHEHQIKWMLWQRSIQQEDRRQFSAPNSSASKHRKQNLTTRLERKNRQIYHYITVTDFNTELSTTNKTTRQKVSKKELGWTLKKEE